MNARHALPLLVAILLQAAPAAAQPDGLGRLFFTPEQRATLDRQRQLNPGLAPGFGESDNAITINGEVRRSGGRSTRWINGEADWNNTAPLPRLPVGDTFHPETGVRESVLGDGRIVVRRPRQER